MRYFNLKTRTAAVCVTALCAMVFAFFRFAYSDESLFVSATVGAQPKPPIITAVSPSLSPITVLRNASQTVSLQVDDVDNAGTSIAYTVSVSSGAVVPQNGTAPVVGGKATVDFTYYAPSSKAKLVPVTVTLDDQSGAAVTVKTVDFYVY